MMNATSVNMLLRNTFVGNRTCRIEFVALSKRLSIESRSNVISFSK